MRVTKGGSRWKIPGRSSGWRKRRGSRRTGWCVRRGCLLAGEGPDTFGADSPHRLRLVEYAHQRGISDEELALATKERGDLLGIFHDLNAEGSAPRDLASAARAADIPDELFTVLADILAIEGIAVANDDDGVAAIDLLGKALSFGLPREALLQLIRVFADATERLANAEARIFHDYVHEQFRADGLSGRDLLEATDAIAKPPSAWRSPRSFTSTGADGTRR